MPVRDLHLGEKQKDIEEGEYQEFHLILFTFKEGSFSFCLWLVIMQRK